MKQIPVTVLSRSQRKTTELNHSNANAEQIMEDLEKDPTYSDEFKKNVKLLKFFADEANAHKADEDLLEWES